MGISTIMRASLSLLLLGLAAVAQTASVHEVRREWNEFKTTHSKQYASEEEENARFAIYLDNKKTIEEHNILYEAGKISWEVGMNAFGDMIEDEFKAQYLGQVLPRGSGDRVSCPYFSDTVDTPHHFDWRDHGAVTDVKDQGACGSCWSFAATGSMEGRYFQDNGELVSMSEQNLLDCAQIWGCNGGGRSDIALKYVESDGLNSEADYPYQHVQHNCRQSTSNPIYKCSGCVWTDEGDEHALKMALVQEGPVAVAIDASPLHFQFFKNGIIDDPNCGTDYPDINHAVLAVGYGKENGDHYWIIKNSWGKSWGEQGYFKLAMNKNMCGVATDTVFAKGPCSQA